MVDLPIGLSQVQGHEGHLLTVDPRGKALHTLRAEGVQGAQSSHEALKTQTRCVKWVGTASNGQLSVESKWLLQPLTGDTPQWLRTRFLDGL